MDNTLLITIRDEIAKGIQLNVNGKIDKMQKGLEAHNAAHEQHMQRMMPIIEAYEEGQHDLKTVRKVGRGALMLSGAITALGGAYIVIHQILFSR